MQIVNPVAQNTQACAPATIEPSPPNQLAPLLFLDLTIPRLPPVERESERLTSYVVLRKPISSAGAEDEQQQFFTDDAAEADHSKPG
jgi:hypothetical protein|eukprot:COSAG06_NODE_956_length_11322_cov_30.048383_11_plen_87_part_00